MSRKEFSRGSVLARVAAGTITLTEAVPLLGVSYRQTKRIWQRYRTRGTAGLVHGNVGRRSNHAHAAVKRAQVLALIRTHYGGRWRRASASASVRRSWRNTCGRITAFWSPAQRCGTGCATPASGVARGGRGPRTPDGSDGRISANSCSSMAAFTTGSRAADPGRASGAA